MASSTSSSVSWVSCSSSSSSNSSSAARRAGSEAGASSVLGQAGRDERPVQVHPQAAGENRWPAVSFARMRAGLRSALKTDCSGFMFQNGGRSLRWFKEHPEDAKERGRLFWQGHGSLFQEHWELVKLPVLTWSNPYSLWAPLALLDIAYRERYSAHDSASRTADRAHARAMLKDGTTEQAVRWALDARSDGMEGELFAPSGSLYTPLLIALALEDRWTWLLEPWQATVESFLTEGRWRAMIAVGAIETGSLALIQEHWVYVRTENRSTAEISRAIGCSGSVQVFDWLVEHGFTCGSREGRATVDLMQSALEYGHVTLTEHLMSHAPIAREVFGARSPVLLQYAYRGGHLHAVEWLVSRGAVLDLQDLTRAVEYGQYSILRYLCAQCGLSCTPKFDNVVPTLVGESKPHCLPILEFLAQHFQYFPTSEHIVRAATAANVRPDVLHFLAEHATQEEWDGALADRHVGEDLDVQDLMHAAARDAGRPRIST